VPRIQSPNFARPRNGSDSPTIVLDLLAFDSNGTLGSLAETGEPKGKIGGLDSHERLKDTTLRAAGES